MSCFCTIIEISSLSIYGKSVDCKNRLSYHTIHIAYHELFLHHYRDIIFNLDKFDLIYRDTGFSLLHRLNCDETGLPLAHKPPKVVAHATQKHPYAVTSGDKSQITILACASASGYTIPPMIIFDRKHLQIGEVPGTLCGLSGSGWMASVLFEEWFTSHFLVHAPSIRPLLRLLDGHASHYNPETGCRGGYYTFLPAASHHTSPAAIRQWGIRIVEGPLEK